MTEHSSVLNAALPLLGLVIGAACQYWFSRISESQKQLQIVRTQAYVDYLKAVAESAFGSVNARANATEAKTRIAVFGSSSVIAALADFEKGRAVLDNPESIALFLNMVQTMRSGRGQVSTDNLQTILLGSMPKRPTQRK